MKPGDLIWVRVDKADGRPYRWWQVFVEAVEDECVITYSGIGNAIYLDPQRFSREVYTQGRAFRSYYWPGRRHNVLEVYEPDGRLAELYADITSPIVITADEIRFIDHELDVSQLTGQPAQIIDQDEFAEAAERFGYSDEFVRESYTLAEQLLEVLTNWPSRGFRYPAPQASP